MTRKQKLIETLLKESNSVSIAKIEFADQQGYNQYTMRISVDGDSPYYSIIRGWDTHSGVGYSLNNFIWAKSLPKSTKGIKDGKAFVTALKNIIPNIHKVDLLNSDFGLKEQPNQKCLIYYLDIPEVGFSNRKQTLIVSLKDNVFRYSIWVGHSEKGGSMGGIRLDGLSVPIKKEDAPNIATLSNKVQSALKRHRSAPIAIVKKTENKFA